MKKLFADPKVTTSHQTVTDDGARVVDQLRKLEEVTKIVIGPIEPNRSRTPRVKTLPLRAGLLVKVQGHDSLQQLYVYTKEPDAVRTHLLK